MTRGESAEPTFRLVERPSFWKGFGSLFDFRFGAARQEKLSDPDADRRAFEADWQAVGEDMRRALNTYERSQRAGTRTA